MRRLILIVCAAVLPALAASTASAQAPASPTRDEPPAALVGRWKLDVKQSHYVPGPPLRDETRVYTRGSDGVTGVVTRTYADGHVERYQYVANFGGEYMVTGNPQYDAVKLTRIDPLASEAVLSHAGSVYGVARRRISADGNTMTITFDRTDRDVPVHNVAVYHKQRP
jgi:hypothetical protein